ncbi:hypothetical protein MHYP_G00314230 [Metynnis hypsauchen]
MQESLALESEEEFSSSDQSGEDGEEERLYFEKRIDPKEDFCNRIKGIDGQPIGRGTITATTIPLQLTTALFHTETMSLFIIDSPEHPIVLGYIV